MVPEYLACHLIYRFQHAVQELFLREFPPFYPCQFSFPARGEGGVGHLHTAYRLIQEKPFRGRDDIFTRITDVFTFQQRAENIRAGGDGAELELNDKSKMFSEIYC